MGNTNFEYFYDEMPEHEARNHAYFLGMNEVHDVSKVDNPTNPRNLWRETESEFVTFDGGEPAKDTPDYPDYEDMTQLAEMMGVPEEYAMPGLDENGEEYSIGELMEIQAELPRRIVDYAAEKGYTILPVLTKPDMRDPDKKRYEVGYPTEQGEEFAGFIYSNKDGVKKSDLEQEVTQYDAYANDEVYQVQTVVNINPGENLSVYSTETLYGSDPADNGLYDKVDPDKFLGRYSSFNDLMANKDVRQMNINEENKLRDARITELYPKFDSRKSFGGKAVVQEFEDHKTLLSYGKPALVMGKDGTITRMTDDISMTTARHMKEFLLQEGVDVNSMKGRTTKEKLNTLPGRDYKRILDAAHSTHNELAKEKEKNKEQDVNR